MVRLGRVGVGVVTTGERSEGEAVDPGAAGPPTRQPASWYRLSVFDDGWVELPGAARQSAHTRGDLRRAAATLVVTGAAIGVAILISRFRLNDMWSLVVHGVFALTVLVLVGVLIVTQLRRSIRRFGDARADHEQLRWERATRGPLRRTPGAPLFRRASSATELASWLTPVRLVAVGDVADVRLTTHETDHVATVTLRDGSTRTYSSPDVALHRLLGRFGAGTPARPVP